MLQILKGITDLLGQKSLGRKRSCVKGKAASIDGEGGGQFLGKLQDLSLVLFLLFGGQRQASHRHSQGREQEDSSSAVPLKEKSYVHPVVPRSYDFTTLVGLGSLCQPKALASASTLRVN